MKRIKKKLSFLYKSLIRLIFTIVYGRIFFCKSPENEKDISIKEVKDENLKDPDNWVLASNEYNKYYQETIIGLKNNIYSSFDHYINQKYKVEINYKTLEKLKNYFR